MRSLHFSVGVADVALFAHRTAPSVVMAGLDPATQQCAPAARKSGIFRALLQLFEES
jgi:hypothetical protein